MNLGTILAAIGAIITMIFAFANLGMYLVGSRDWGAFALLMVIAAGIGALPGLLIRVLTANDKGHRKPPA